MADVGEAFVRIKPNFDGFNSEVERGASGLAGTLKKIAVGAAAAFAVKQGIDFVKGGVESLAGLEKLAAQTGAVLKSTGGAANVTAKEIAGLAESIEKTTGIEQEGVRAGANLLLTFTNIKNGVGAGNDIFNQSTRILTDMSVALGTDVPAASIQLGKALNDPIAGISALTRVGVTFSEEQKNLIKQLVETGDVAGAQKVILAELNKEFGGSAEAAGNTAAGGLAKFKNAVGDLQESIAGALMPALSGLIPAVTPIIAALQPVLQIVGQGLAQIFTAAGPLITQLGAGFANLLQQLLPLLEPIGQLVGVAVSLVPPFAQMAATLIGGLAPAFANLLTQLVPVLNAMIQQMAPILPQLARDLLPLMLALLRLANAVLLPLLPLLINISTGGFAFLAKAVHSAEPVITAIAKAIDFVSGAVQRAMGWVSKLAGVLGKLSIPSFLERHSPSEIEQSLFGMTAGMRAAVGAAGPLARSLGGLSRPGSLAVATLPGSSGAGGGLAGGPTFNNNTFIGTTDQLVDFVRQRIYDIDRRNG